MELDFDKEIDAILRNARRDSPAIPASRHLDADEISAFAENAMPEKSRSLYAAHMADCDRCRRILSGVLTLNAEAAPAAVASPSAITIAERSTPWYRKMFLFPNLAYVMGGLVLIFGGFLAFSVIQKSGEPMTAAVAPSEQPAMSATSEGGPRFEPGDADAFNSSAANSAANVAMPDASRMAAANSNAAVSSVGTQPGGPRVPENNFATDLSAADTTAVQAAPPPATVAAAEPVAQPKTLPPARDDLAAKAKSEEKEVQSLMQESQKKDALMKQQAGVPAQSGPMNNQRQYDRQLENMDASRRDRSGRANADGNESSGRKVVGGRTFERKQGVWYDTGYQGHPTINVRRGSDEFKRLAAGLRNIANSLSGTIVVVWGSKAYRIQ